jgi:uncharacterized protein
LKFNIKEIGPDGRALRQRLDDRQVRGVLRQVQIETLPGFGEVEVDLQLSRLEQTVFVSGSLQGRYAVACSRCLGPCEVKVQYRGLRLTFLPVEAAGAAVAGETELDLQDLDTYTHDGESLDLRPLIREQLVLALPMAPICAEGCRGICSGCGANLNQESCSCDQSQAEPSPWVAALSKIRLKETGD